MSDVSEFCEELVPLESLTNPSGTETEEYLFFNGKRIARKDIPSGAVHYYFSDHLGSTSIVTNATGSIVEDDSDYYPYGGEMVVTDSVPQNYKFTGKERDAETGLDYFGARYYASSMGRWMSPDWAAKPTTVPYANFGDPQSLNLYQYVGNNPLSRADADGHSTLVFNGQKHTITLYSKSGAKLGTWPAYNNVQHNLSIGKLVNGTYSMLDTASPHLHHGSDAKENGPIGPGGVFRMKGFVGADGKPHNGVGIHAGRKDVKDLAGRSGPAFATHGCIRTTDAAIAAITKTAKTDPLTSTTVK